MKIGFLVTLLSITQKIRSYEKFSENNNRLSHLILLILHHSSYLTDMLS